MRNGAAYELPTWEQRMADSGSLSSQNDVELFMTPVAKEGEKATFKQGSAQKAKTGQVWLTNQVRDIYDLNLFPTPTAMDHKQSGGAEGSANVTLTDAVIRGRGASVILLPTPSANIGSNGGSQHPDKRRAGGHQPSIQDVAEHELTTDWGRYEPAVRRWEHVLGRPAPSPVEPNTRNGHRLSARFDEWLMGAPEGWITDVDISWNDKIKACGNGVVSQQAAAALGDMLAAFNMRTREEAA